MPSASAWIDCAYWRDPGQNTSQRCTTGIVNCDDLRRSRTTSRTRMVRRTGNDAGPRVIGAEMADKSPRQSLTKKFGKSPKEKRAKAGDTLSTEDVLHPRKR